MKRIILISVLIMSAVILNAQQFTPNFKFDVPEGKKILINVIDQNIPSWSYPYQYSFAEYNIIKGSARIEFECPDCLTKKNNTRYSKSNTIVKQKPVVANQQLNMPPFGINVNIYNNIGGSNNSNNNVSVKIDTVKTTGNVNTAGSISINVQNNIGAISKEEGSPTNPDGYMTFESMVSYMDTKIAEAKEQAKADTKLEMAEINSDILMYNKYHTNGLVKIVSGISCYVVSAGLIGFSEVPKYENSIVETTNMFDYDYWTYELNEIPGSTDYNTGSETSAKCGNNHHKPCDPCPRPNPQPVNPPVVNVINNININNTINIITINPGYTLNGTSHTGTITYVDRDEVTREVKRNKTPYYIAAGGFAILGTALEVWGISDLCKAHKYKEKIKLYYTGNTVGLIKRF